MNTEKYTPKFLKKLDTYLLKNKPAIWSSRIHFVLFYTTLLSVIFFFVLLLINKDPRENSSEFTWIILLSIIIIISIVLFIIYLFRFNVMKRFGNWNSKDSLLSFVFLFITFSLIYFLALIPSITESIFANKKYNFGELINDQNQYNKAIALLEKDSLRFAVYEIDTVILITDTNRYSKTKRTSEGYADFINIYESNTDEINTVTVAPAEDPHDVKNTIHCDSSEFYEKQKSEDSIMILNDTSFIRYNIPEFEFCNAGSYHFSISSYLFSDMNDYYDDESVNYINPNFKKIYTVKKWSTIKMYHEVLNEINQPDVVKYQKIISTIQDKYLINDDKSEPEDNFKEYLKKHSYISYSPIAFSKFLEKKYFCSELERRINNIVDRKNQWNNYNAPNKLYVWFYLSLGSAIFLWLFRHNTKKSYFLSFLFTALLFLATSIFMIFAEFNDTEIYYVVIFYFIALSMLSIRIYYLKTQKILPAIATNILVLSTCFIPMFIVSFAFYLKRLSIDKYSEAQNDYLDKLEITLLYWSQCIGFILLLVAIYFLYSKLYKKWIALPEE